MYVCLPISEHCSVMNRVGQNRFLTACYYFCKLKYNVIAKSIMICMFCKRGSVIVYWLFLLNLQLYIFCSSLSIFVLLCYIHLSFDSLCCILNWVLLTCWWHSVLMMYKVQVYSWLTTSNNCLLPTPRRYCHHMSVLFHCFVFLRSFKKVLRITKETTLLFKSKKLVTFGVPGHNCHSFVS